MPPNMSSSGSKNRFNKLWIPLIITILLLVVALIFGMWTYGRMLDYKDNVDKKVADASAQAKQQTSTAKDKEFAEKEKSPFKHFKGPETYGSIDFQYPKTWSAYVDQTNSNTPLNGYLHPDFVPGITSGTAFALRVVVVNVPYDKEMQQIDSKVKSGKIKTSPYRAPAVNNILGSRAVGEINVGQKDTKIYLPLRDKTIEIWTESDQFVSDLDSIVLANLKFSP